MPSQRVVINKADLPAVDMNGVYTIRLRFMSDDKNTQSYWTPIYNIVLPTESGTKKVQDAVSANVYHVPVGVPLTNHPQNYNVYVSWYDPNGLGEYDVYTQWKNSSGWTDWQHIATVSNRTFTFSSPMHLATIGNPSTFFTMYNVAVTRSNFNRVYNPDLALFSTATSPAGGISLV